MKKDDSVPLSQNGNDDLADRSTIAEDQIEKKKDKQKKKKKNYWPLKAMIITFCISFFVNAGSELILEGAQLWLAIMLTCIIIFIGVIFDIVATASTSCDIQPFLSMASRKVKGAKIAVKIAKNGDVVSSICGDIVGDICGIVSGVCAASIAASVVSMLGLTMDFWISVGICAFVSTATITLKAVGKGYAVNNANGVVLFVAKFLSLFTKEG